MGQLLERAKSAATRSLENARGPGIFTEDRVGYVRELSSNLIPGVTRGDFWEDLGSGGGNELESTARVPAKFCAAYSSAALVVNTFGPFRRRPERLSLLGRTGFDRAQFERKCSTGLGGTPPHLDFLAIGKALVCGVESKFLEPLSGKTATFVPAYDALVAEEADAAWQRAYAELKADPMRFNHLDGAQLVKHSLGLRHSFPGWQEVVLLYLFWEPLNADQHREFRTHRQEVEEFAAWVRGGDVRFEARSYSDLWCHWAEQANWDGIADHVLALRTRYEFEI